ncbi:MAG: nucleoside phosphorylase [Desulfobacteraceae bacterium]|nr:nucleoside phosphorylase [Desulfobacteraceae bacterium]
MQNWDSIVRPVSNSRTPVLGPLAYMAASRDDFKTLSRLLDLPDTYNLYMSKLCYKGGDLAKPSLAGPVMGASYASMLLEILHSWGVKTCIFWGWCGSIDPSIHIGDTVYPNAAIIDEGTSVSYGKLSGDFAAPDEHVGKKIQHCLTSHNITAKAGTAWTTDAIFRETPDKVKAFQKKGAQVVEMELSALFSVGRFRSISVASVLSVSDELFTFQWKTGFKNKTFKQSREKVARALADFYL